MSGETAAGPDEIARMRTIRHRAIDDLAQRLLENGRMMDQYQATSASLHR